MRGSVSTLIVFLVCLVAVLIYWFAGRPQLINQLVTVRAENVEISNRLAEISEMERSIPLMMRQLPQWRDKLELYQAAIPNPINDEKFLATIDQQLEAQDVTLIGIDLVKGGAWLGQLGESQIEELKAKGIDDNVARQVQVAFYSVRLMGEFKNVITAFENLKIHNRLFSIDQVTGPITGGTGMISQNLDPNNVPIEITGRIYYGIPANYLTVEQLVDVFNTAVIIPQARLIQSKIARRAQELNPDYVPPAPEDPDTQGGPAIDDEVTEETDTSPEAGDEGTGSTGSEPSDDESVEVMTT